MMVHVYMYSVVSYREGKGEDEWMTHWDPYPWNSPEETSDGLNV